MYFPRKTLLNLLNTNILKVVVRFTTFLVEHADNTCYFSTKKITFGFCNILQVYSRLSKDRHKNVNTYLPPTDIKPHAICFFSSRSS